MPVQISTVVSAEIASDPRGAELILARTFFVASLFLEQCFDDAGVE